MRSYSAVANHFERLAKQEGWQNCNGSIYPVALENLQRYIAFQEGKIKPQPLSTYLSALKEKHEQLEFLKWEHVQFHSSIIRMMRNVKRNHVHTQTRRSRPITRQNLEEIKVKLDRRKPQHVLFWAIAVVAFHFMARLGEILQTDPTHTSTAI